MAKTGILNQERLAHAVPTHRVDSLDEELQGARDAIMRRAYELFETHGLAGARELDDWLAAERELFWQPQATICELDQAFTIDIAMPGLTADDIEVQVTDRCVLVKSDCCTTAGTNDEKIHVDEMPHGRAFRMFELPARLDPAGTTAELRDGVLRIRAPRVAESAARVVPVAA